MARSYALYEKTLKRHFSDYLAYNHRDFKTHPKHTYILDRKYPTETVLLEENRERFKRHVPNNLTIHSPGNLCSSQLMAFDLFLPYFDAPGTLDLGLDASEPIETMVFEKAFSDFTHADLFLKTESGRKILCEVKYMEKTFGHVNGDNPAHDEKFNEVYQAINAWMAKEPVSKEVFFKHYQLYRNLYNALNDESGKLGYFVVVFPSMHPLLDEAFERWRHALDAVHGFKYMDRVRKRYLESMPHPEAFKKKYLHIHHRFLEIELFKKKRPMNKEVVDLSMASSDPIGTHLDRLKQQDHLDLYLGSSSALYMETIQSALDHFSYYNIVDSTYVPAKPMRIMKKLHLYMDD